MFDHTSRYYKIKESGYTEADGERIIYKQRRFLPQGEKIPVLAEVKVLEGDRPDLVTARSLGDPEQFWRVCDANNAMNPFDTTAHPGRRLKIPKPQI